LGFLKMSLFNPGCWLFGRQIYGMENGTLNFYGRLQDVKEFNPELFTVWQEKIKRARYQFLPVADNFCKYQLQNSHS